MIRYHKCQINELEADLILSLHFKHPTLCHLKLGHNTSINSFIHARHWCLHGLYVHFHLIFCFQIGERGEESLSRALVSESRAMEAAQAAAPALGSGAAQAVASGHREHGVVSLNTGVSVSVGPSPSAELPSTEQPIQFTVEFRRAMSSSHTWPPCHMWVWSPIRGHTHCCCDCLANDCFNEMNISWQWSYSNMHILSVRFKCHVSRNACEVMMLYPKFQNPCKVTRFHCTTSMQACVKLDFTEGACFPTTCF